MSLKQSNNKNPPERQSESKNTLKNLFKQKVDGTLCDVQLRLQGSLIWCHACVLATSSLYFTEYFTTNTVEEDNWENHWCLKKPLVIDLERVMCDIEDLCLICVSKIIDFMYLRNLVLMRGHFQHFSKIAHFLKVSDLLPLCRKYCDGGNSPVSINDESSVKQVNKFLSKPDSGINVNNKAEVVHSCSSKLSTDELNRNSQPEDSCVNEPVGLGTIEIVTSNTKETSLQNQIIDTCSNESTEKAQAHISSNVQQCRNETKTIAMPRTFQNKENTTLKRKCEFVCCNTDRDISPSCAGHRKRLKKTCEMCTFTTVSLQKMLKHILSVSHYGTVCPVCSMQTQSVSNLREHLNEHLHVKPYLCHICKKRNLTWKYHKLHLTVHCRNKQFHCEICEKSLNENENLKDHLLTHEENHLSDNYDYLTANINKSTSNDAISRSILHTGLKVCEKEKRFHCELCGDGFTQKRNLKRHTHLKHFRVTEHNCSLCSYVSKRTDLLREHMKKHHSCIPPVVKKQKCKEKKKQSKKQRKLEDALQGPTNIVGVLIPVQLVSEKEKSTLNAFAIKTFIDERLEIQENIKSSPNMDENKINSNSSINIIGRKTELYQPIQVERGDQVSHDISKRANTFINNQFDLENLLSITQTNDTDKLMTNIDLCDEKVNRTHEDCLTTEPGKQRTTFVGEVGHLQVNLSADVPHFDSSANITDPINRMCPCPQELNSLHFVMSKENSAAMEGAESGCNFTESNEDIWLNEATGEFLSGNSFVNVQVIDAGSRVDYNNCITTATGNSTLDFSDPFQTLILNQNSGGLSVFDLGDDNDDNPRTPQTNLVEIDDSDNLFFWDCLDNNFCSTWVLNEATGELNMVSFGIQPLKHSDELKLDEYTGTLSSADDCDTALFLNEGTGDLSVIYLNHSLNEQQRQEMQETLSEHSDDDEDLLNEEFLKASASFMADDVNETFLNELTGEFDITNFSNYGTHIQENQLTGDETYLNEETGEISWNVLDQNIKSDLFTNTDNLMCDFDDSLNCEDLEAFSTEINDFSSQFCLGSGTSNSWNAVDETCETLLNEYTGELVKKI